MLGVVLVYRERVEKNKYRTRQITGIEMPDWFCCLLFQKEIPHCLLDTIWNEFWDKFNCQISDEVYQYLSHNPDALIHMYSPITHKYEIIAERT